MKMKMNRAGNFLAFALLVGLTCSLRAAQVAPTPLPLTSQTRESTLTLAQIVSRQNQHWAQLLTITGQVEWQQASLSRPDAIALHDRKRTIFFANEGTRSLTLMMRSEAVPTYVASHGKVPWPDALSATLIADDSVFMVAVEAVTSKPAVTRVPFNPAVHADNPALAFHPRQLGEERISLESLLSMSARMTARPVISEGMYGGKFLIRIEFINPELPDERLVYLIDPAKGYLPVEITRTSGKRMLSLSSIIIGRAGGEFYVPARKYRTIFNSTGKPDQLESWHYSNISANKSIPPRQLSLTFFYLPDDTEVKHANGSISQIKAIPTTNATPAPIGQRIQPRVTVTPNRVHRSVY